MPGACGHILIANCRAPHEQASSMRWKLFAPFCFYAPLAAALAVAAAYAGSQGLAAAAMLIVAGFLSWGVLEYALHRFVFHHDARSARARAFVHAVHLAHHEEPRSLDRLVASLQLSLPIAAAYWLLMWAVTGSWSAACWLFVGLTAGYFFYEWMHYQAHHGSPRSRLIRYLKRYHLLHHYGTEGRRYGVTSPVLDLACGTFEPAGRERVLERRSCE
jgi:hypothetical protein